MAVLLTIVCIVTGVVATLTMLVLLAAVAPNSTEAQSRRLRFLAVGFALLGGASAAGAITLLLTGLHGWAGAVALAPVIATAITVTVSLVRSRGPSKRIAHAEAATMSDGPRDRPGWWRLARELEVADQLDAAEKLIRDAIPNMAFAIEIAELYKDRYVRLRELGNGDAAAAAFAKAEDWARFYASMATSGGEGIALSAERDEFIASLRRA